MKRSLKVLFIALFTLLVFNLINYESVSTEIETMVDSKFDCLSDYGGEIGEVEYTSGNAYSGKIKMNIKRYGKEDAWDADTQVIQVDMRASSSGFTMNHMKEIKYRIYANNSTLCTGNLSDLVDTSKPYISFKTIFKQHGWFVFEVTGVDSEKEFDTKAKEVKIDKESPVISDAKFNLDDEGLTVSFNASDIYSGLRHDAYIGYKSSIGMKNNSAYTYPHYNSDGDKDDKQKNYSLTVKKNQIVDGEYVFQIYVFDKVGNKSEVKEYHLSTVDSNGNRLTGEIIPFSSKTEEALNKQELKEKIDQEEEDKKNKPLGDDCDPNDPNCALNGGIYISGNRDFTCDNGLTEFIKKYWKWVTILTPALLMAMCTVDFVKALVSSNADELKKAGTNTIKRVIATLLLVCLPLLLNTVMNLIGVEFCW